MTRFALLTIVAACGGSGPTPRPVIDNAGGAGSGVPPALFAALFVDGRSFVYDVETSFLDETDARADSHGFVHEAATMTCQIIGVRSFSRAIAADLQCNGSTDPQTTPSGIWVATPTGIWRLASYPLDDTAIAALDPRTMVLAAEPVATPEATEQADIDNSNDYWWIERLSDGTWCSIHHNGGDGSGDSICFAPNHGLVRGATSYPGGETRDVVYTLNR